MENKIKKIKAGVFSPFINLNKCESDGHCISVCPNDVLALKEISEADYKTLTIIGKLKTKVHGRKKAVVLNPNDCIACGECVNICPEKAIILQKIKL